MFFFDLVECRHGLGIIMSPPPSHARAAKALCFLYGRTEDFRPHCRRLLVYLDRTIWRVLDQCLLQASLGGNFRPAPKTYNLSERLPNCALNLFFRQRQRITNISRNFLLMDNEHRKLFAIKQSKGCRFMPKMYQNTFGGRAPPGPAGGACALPQVP